MIYLIKYKKSENPMIPRIACLNSLHMTPELLFTKLQSYLGTKEHVEAVYIFPPDLQDKLNDIMNDIDSWGHKSLLKLV